MYYWVQPAKKMFRGHCDSAGLHVWTHSQSQLAVVLWIVDFVILFLFFELGHMRVIPNFVIINMINIFSTPPIHTPPPTDPGVSPKWTPPSSLTSSSSSPSPSATSWTGPASSGYSRVSRDRDALATVSPKLGIPTNICIEYYNPVKLMYAFCNYQYHCKLTVWRWLSR